jgi:DNA-binding LacI/PurR family transcriptional regulator
MRTSRVVSDNFEGSYQLTKHLIDQGCNRIAHISGSQNLNDCRKRFLGYKSAMRDNGLSIDDDLIIFSDYHKGNVKEYTHKLLSLSQPPDGILAINDTVAIEMMHIIKEKKVKIPQDIAIVGFNNDGVSAFVSPPLTSLEFHPFEIGQTAGTMLLEHLNNENYTVEKKVIKSQLVIRKSSAYSSTME